jgi:hypothetical protein
VCAGAKLNATGKAAGAALGCHARAARQGVTVDGGCVAKAHAKLTNGFASAETRGGCATTGDASDIGVLVDSSVGAFVAELRPAMTASRCAGMKLEATGKKAKTKLACHAKATRRGLAVDGQCLTRAEMRFAAAFAAADASPTCLTMHDAADVEGKVDHFVDQVVAAIPSETTTTTTSTSTSTSTTTTSLVFFPPCGAAGGGGTCNGICFGTDVCTPSFEPQSANPFACLCYPVGVVPCTGSSYPTCGGTCSGDEVCQALHDDGANVSICGCVSPTIACESPGGPGTCSLGTCPTGSACIYQPLPAPTCACGTPATITSTTTTSSTSTTSTTIAAVCGNGIREGTEQCDTTADPAFCFDRGGCFPAGSLRECTCCTLPGQTSQLTFDPNFDVCCDGASPQPGGPNHYLCPGTCGSSSFPTCGGSCDVTTRCAAIILNGSQTCACVPNLPCAGTCTGDPQCCTGAVCSPGQACDASTCSCVVP